MKKMAHFKTVNFRSESILSIYKQMSKKSERARKRDGETEQKSRAVFSVVVQLKNLYGRSLLSNRRVRHDTIFGRERERERER